MKDSCGDHLVRQGLQISKQSWLNLPGTRGMARMWISRWLDVILSKWTKMYQAKWSNIDRIWSLIYSNLIFHYFAVPPVVQVVSWAIAWLWRLKWESGTRLSFWYFRHFDEAHQLLKIDFEEVFCNVIFISWNQQ